MFKGLTWVIVIIVLNAVVAALAKKAQANALAAKQGDAPTPPPPPPVQQQGAAARPSRVVVRIDDGSSTSMSRGAQSVKAPRPPKPPQGRAYIVEAVGDSSDAMQSRRRLAEEVAKVKAAEAKVAQASGIKADHSAMLLQVAPKIAPLGAADLRKALRNPADIRKALVFGEILGRPRGTQAL